MILACCALTVSEPHQVLRFTIGHKSILKSEKVGLT